MGDYRHAPLATGNVDIEGQPVMVDVEGRLRRVYLCDDGIWKAQVIFAMSLTGYAVNVHPISLIKVRCPNGIEPPKRLMGVPWPA